MMNGEIWWVDFQEPLRNLEKKSVNFLIIEN